MSDEDERQHKNAHALAGALQEALEDFLQEHEDGGNKLSPMATLMGVQILAQGWALFMKHRGVPAELMLACSIQAIACSTKLLAYLDESESRLVPAPAPSAASASQQPQHDGPLWQMPGPTEEC